MDQSDFFAIFQVKQTSFRIHAAKYAEIRSGMLYDVDQNVDISEGFKDPGRRGR